MFVQPEPLSAKRRALCSRENAERIASQIFDQGIWPVHIIRTGNALQPFRVSIAPVMDEHVEVEMLC